MIKSLKTFRQKLRYKKHTSKAKNITDLNELGAAFQTDKVGSHFYTQHYDSHFHRYRDKPINILEIGVGGYEKSYKGGQSLRMWKKYFPKGRVFALDIYDKSPLQEDRITIFKGSQVDEPFLNKVVEEIGEIDLIVDDGSHVNEHVIKTFEILFPKLKDGGIYAIEDVQTSYWKDYGGDSKDLDNPKTMMNFFKGLTDCLNNKEFINPDYKPSYYDKKITSMHFYHNMIFIYKGDNDEESNIVVDNGRGKPLNAD